MKATILFGGLGSLEIFNEIFPLAGEPWRWLARIPLAFAELERTSAAKGEIRSRGDGIYVHPTAQVDASAHLEGPVFIGAHAVVRCGALIRGPVIVGSRCTVGQCCELKNSLILDGAQVPHFNYVGDSILGAGAHLGAGAVLANLRLDCQPISLRTPEGLIPTGLHKLGAILGDGSQVGCNAVLQPGTVLGKFARVHPAIAFGGHVPDYGSVYPASRPIIRIRHP
jgi:NDP-sugar pyrophosphorylase family protein